MGLSGVTPHSARATFITQALENKCPIEAVQKTVGHALIKTTQMYDKRDLNYRESASFAVEIDAPDGVDVIVTPSSVKFARASPVS